MVHDKEMAELFPLAEVNKVYEPGATLYGSWSWSRWNNEKVNASWFKCKPIVTSIVRETPLNLKETPSKWCLTLWKFNVPKAIQKNSGKGGKELNA